MSTPRSTTSGPTSGFGPGHPRLPTSTVWSGSRPAGATRQWCTSMSTRCSDMPPRTIVVGAGIAGLTTALSLEAEGVPVEVYEAVPEVRALGGGINLQPHAVRELDALGLLSRVLDRSVAPAELIYFTRRGQEIWREARGQAAGYPWPQVSIHRGELQELLLDAVLDRVGEEHLHLGRRLVRVRHDGAQVMAEFQDGTTVEGDALAAADGIHRAVRAQLFPDEGPPQWNGSLMWRGTARVPRLLDGRTLVWAGHPDQKFVAYPIRDLPDGQLLNFIAELRRPEADLANREDWNKRGDLADFLPAFEEWRFEWLDVPATIRAAEATYLFPMVDRDPLPCARPRPPAVLAARSSHAGRGRRPPDVSHRVERCLPGHPRRPGARGLLEQGRRRRAGPRRLRVGTTPGYVPPGGGEPGHGTRAAHEAGRGARLRGLHRHRRGDHSRGDPGRHRRLPEGGRHGARRPAQRPLRGRQSAALTCRLAVPEPGVVAGGSRFPTEERCRTIWNMGMTHSSACGLRPSTQHLG